MDTSATGFRSPKERSSASTSCTATPVALEETLVAAEDPEGAESVAVGPVAVPEQAVEQDKTADVPGPSGISGSGYSELSRKEEGEPRKKKRKPNKLERVEKSMQKMIDSFLASAEKGSKEFIELEKKKMEMENEAARIAGLREERFLQVMQQTILMACQPTPAPQPNPQPQHSSGMYHFDLS